VSGPQPTLRCDCGGQHLVPAFAYDAPPDGETRFDLGGQTYARAYDRCTECGHWFGRHEIDLSDLYGQAYVDSTYKGPNGMRTRLAQILALPPERSDNAGRVMRVCSFAAERVAGSVLRILDVGAGIGVFPAAMKAAGWDVVAVEPDSRTAAHLRESAGVAAHALPIEALDPAVVGHFDAITFNKVLEHVEDPVGMLAAARPLLAPGGFVYVEVPDADGASPEGPGREEFFIEHHHVFTADSLRGVAARSGFAGLEVGRIREPSTKYTVFGFLAPR